MKPNGSCKKGCKGCTHCVSKKLRESVFGPPKKDTGPTIEEANQQLIDQFIQNVSGNELLTYRFNESYARDTHPLLILATMGHEAGVDKLLAAGADVDMRHPQCGSTPLILASRRGHVNIMQKLIDAGAKLCPVNIDGINAFMAAVMTGNAEPVNLLWKHRNKFDINQSDKRGYNALFLAAERTWDSCVTLLLKGGVWKHHRANDGTTPLIIAAKKGDQKTAEQLVAAGVNPLLRDQKNCTAICYSIKKKHTNLADFFLSHLTPEQEQTYVMLRLVLLSTAGEDEETDQFLTDTLYPVIQALAERREARRCLHNCSLIKRWLPVIQSHLEVEAMSEKAFICLFRLLIDVFAPYSIPGLPRLDYRFVEDFQQQDGQALLVEAMGTYTAANNLDMAATAFLPLLPASANKEGRRWLEQNYHKITQHFQTFDEHRMNVACSDDTMKFVCAFWNDFQGRFQNIQKRGSDRLCAELMATEEREKMRRERRREKRKQKRRQQSQKSQGPTDSAEILQEGETSNAPPRQFADICTNAPDDTPICTEGEILKRKKAKSESTECPGGKTKQSSNSNLKHAVSNDFPSNYKDGLGGCARDLAEKNDAPFEQVLPKKSKRKNKVVSETALLHKAVSETLPSRSFFEVNTLLENASVTKKVNSKTKHSKRGCKGSAADTTHNAPNATGPWGALFNLNSKEKSSLSSNKHELDSFPKLAGNLMGVDFYNPSSSSEAKKNNENSPPSKKKKKPKPLPLFMWIKDGHLGNSSEAAIESQSTVANTGEAERPLMEDHHDVPWDVKEEFLQEIPMEVIEEYMPQYVEVAKALQQKTGKLTSNTAPPDQEAVAVKEVCDSGTGSTCDFEMNEKKDGRCNEKTELSVARELSCAQQDGNPDKTPKEVSSESLPSFKDQLSPESPEYKDCMETDISDFSFSSSEYEIKNIDLNHLSDDNVSPNNHNKIDDVDDFKSAPSDIYLEEESIEDCHLSLEKNAYTDEAVDTNKLDVDNAQCAHPDSDETHECEHLSTTSLVPSVCETYSTNDSHLSDVSSRVSSTEEMNNRNSTDKVNMQIQGNEPQTLLTESNSNEGVTGFNWSDLADVTQMLFGKPSQKNISPDNRAESNKTAALDKNTGDEMSSHESHQSNCCNVENSVMSADHVSNDVKVKDKEAWMPVIHELLSRYTTADFANLVMSNQSSLEIFRYFIEQNQTSSSYELIENIFKENADFIKSMIPLISNMFTPGANSVESNENCNANNKTPSTAVSETEQKFHEPFLSPTQQIHENTSGILSEGLSNLRPPSGQSVEFATLTPDTPDDNPVDPRIKGTLWAQINPKWIGTGILSEHIPDPLTKLISAQRSLIEGTAPQVQEKTQHQNIKPMIFTSPVSPIDRAEVKARGWLPRGLGCFSSDESCSDRFDSSCSFLGETPSSLSGMRPIRETNESSVSFLDAGASPVLKPPPVHGANAGITLEHGSPKLAEQSPQQSGIPNIPVMTSPSESFATGFYLSPRDQNPKCVITPPHCALNIKWEPRSLRWREAFHSICTLPNKCLQTMGPLIIPQDINRFVVGCSESNHLVMLGLTTHGQEVAVKRVPLKDFIEIKNEQLIILQHIPPHDNIIRVLGSQWDKEYGYIVMELGDFNLADFLRWHAEANCTRDTLVGVVEQILRGLQHMHESCHIVHGNLKPENVLICPHGTVRLADFGKPDYTTQAGLWQLPAAVTASSTADDFQHGLNTDVHAAGMLVYYTLTGGCHPYGSDIYEINLNLAHGIPQLSPVNKEADDLIHKMLSRSENERVSIGEAARHPLFWKADKCFRFLLVVASEVLQEIRQGNKHQLNARLEERAANCEDIQNWTGTVEPSLYQEVGNTYQVDTTLCGPATHLLLFVDRAAKTRAMLSESSRIYLNNAGSYFLTRFPSLLMVAYVSVRECKRAKQGALAAYF